MPFTDIVATFTDADPNSTVFDYTVTIDWGDGHTSFGIVSANPGGGFNVTGTNTYTEPGPYPVGIVITNDMDGRTAAAHSRAVVADAPLLAVSAPITATEGKPLNNVTVATFTDAGGAEPASHYKVTIDWGDGTRLDMITGTVSGAGGNFTVTGSHTYTEEGSFPVVVTIAGAAASEVPRSVATVSALARVADAALSATAAAPLSATAGTPVQDATVATFVDAGGPESANRYEAVIDWGDGTPQTRGTITLDRSTFTVSGGHTFASPGTFNGSVTVRSFGDSVTTTAFTSTVSALTLIYIPVTATEGVPLAGVTVATLRSDDGPDPSAGFYTALVDWGDNTPPSPGTITGSGSTLRVTGSHTYAESGTYPVRVTVGTASNPALVTDTRPTAVADAPIVLVGEMDPASDSGVSNQDRVHQRHPAALLRHVRTGVGRAGVRPAGGRVPGADRRTTADAGGAWNITSNVPLADAPTPSSRWRWIAMGVTEATAPLTSLVVDTTGPQVAGLTFDRLRGQFTVTLQDERSGLDQRTLIDGANYQITRPRTRPGRLRITSLTATVPSGPSGLQVVTGLINDGRRIGPGSYDILARSGGITDVAGNALDGEFYGFFPSGNGPRGGDFRARIDAVGRIASAPQPAGSSATPLNPPGTPGRRVIIGQRTPQRPLSLVVKQGRHREDFGSLSSGRKAPKGGGL
jgi:hypothetical protein